MVWCYKQRYSDKTQTLRKCTCTCDRKLWYFYILKVLFLKCRYIRWYKWCMLVGVHVPTNFAINRQISKCTDKSPKIHYGGGGGNCPLKFPPFGYTNAVHVVQFLIKIFQNWLLKRKIAPIFWHFFLLSFFFFCTLESTGRGNFVFPTPILEKLRTGLSWCMHFQVNFMRRVRSFASSMAMPFHKMLITNKLNNTLNRTYFHLK